MDWNKIGAIASCLQVLLAVAAVVYALVEYQRWTIDRKTRLNVLAPHLFGELKRCIRSMRSTGDTWRDNIRVGHFNNLVCNAQSMRIKMGAYETMIDRFSLFGAHIGKSLSDAAAEMFRLNAALDHFQGFPIETPGAEHQRTRDRATAIADLIDGTIVVAQKALDDLRTIPEARTTVEKS